MSPAGYHLTSLLIHSLNALLCYVLAYRLLELGFGSGARPGDLRLAAIVAALFFALHPLRVESVACITERRDILMGMFAFSTLLVWLRACRSGADGRPARRWYWAAVVAALLSKVMVVGLPIVLVALDVYPLRRIGASHARWRTRLVRLTVAEKAPFLLLSAAAVVMTLALGHLPTVGDQAGGIRDA